MEYECPRCAEKLMPVEYHSNSLLNFEQWSSTIAGDYYCNKCKGERGKSGKRYYWKSELEELLVSKD